MRRIFAACICIGLLLANSPGAIEAQTKPVPGNILVTQNAGISEVSSTDFNILQTIPWPEVAEETKDRPTVSSVAYDGQQIIYVLANDLLESSQYANPRILRWDVTSKAWLDAIALPDFDQQYKRMVLVGDNIVAGGRKRNVQVVLSTGKIYRMPTGPVAGQQSDKGSFVFIYNSHNDRERPVSKIDLSDGSIAQKLSAKYGGGDFIIDQEDNAFSVTSSTVYAFQLLSKGEAEPKRGKSPKERKRGMDKSDRKAIYRVGDSNSVQELNDELLIISHQSDRRLLTINKDLEPKSGKTYEFEFNTGPIFVVK